MARKRKDDPFDAWRVRRKLKLKNIDPGAEPFTLGSRQADEAKLAEVAVEIDRLQDLLYANAQSKAPRKLLLVLQGLDTSGKDGTTRTVFTCCSPLGVRVQTFKAPSTEERAHDFLWRVHAVVPRAGEITVFNRSHYEDVLVPVVEGWIDEAERKRRCAHILAFERLLMQTGTTIVKCFLHISKDEQRQRLQARLDEPAKQWKFNPADLATRAKWKAYLAAYEMALAATSTKEAPWYVVPSDSKSHRNLMVGAIVWRALARMKLKPPVPDYDPAAVKID